MTRGRPSGTLLVVGPGRLGLALGWELLTAGEVARVVFSGTGPRPPEHPAFDHEAVEYVGPESLPERSPDAILIAVPDGSIGAVALNLASADLPPIPVLHTSGVLGPEPLRSVADLGCAIGSLHPLVSIADPVRDAAKLRGARYGVEGSPGAMQVAHAFVDALGGKLIRIDPHGKPLYHAAAVIAANYAVALLAVAERVMRQAGVEPDVARDALTSLAAGAVENVASSGPVDALTGPISRGDIATVALHLGRLSGEDRQLYSVLAREALLLAQARGLSPEAAARLEDLVQGAEP